MQKDNEGDLNITWYPAVYCKDLYSNFFDEENAPDYDGNGFFHDEFTSSTSNEWICPNVTSIDLFNDPYNYQRGLNFNMVVNSCETA